jgi:putative nucleotidyltransferase with HDIG domain
MLEIPFKIRPLEVTSLIQQQIVNDVNELPTFPEHILELQKMCRDRDVTIPRIAEKISLDPSVSASVIKLSNSAGFITSRHIDTIADAVKIIGLKNLNALLVATATRKILDDRFSSFKDVWHHCNKAAFYARNIALEKGLKDTADHAFLAALLHDLGKIVLLSTNSELAEHIEEVTVSRQMRTSTVLEEITMGISHSLIGKMIALKWNFPDYIVEAIEFHHSPLKSGSASMEVVYVTYAANVMCLLEERKFDYMYMEDDVLNYLAIKNEDDFRELHEKLKKAYLNQAEL